VEAYEIDKGVLCLLRLLRVLIHIEVFAAAVVVAAVVAQQAKRHYPLLLRMA